MDKWVDSFILHVGHVFGQKDSWVDSWIHGLTDRQILRQADRQTQTGRQIDRHAGRETDGGNGRLIDRLAG